MNGDVRLGVVGTGRIMLKSYLPILAQLPGVQVSALCDVNEQRLREAVALLPYLVDTYADYNELLERADLDAVMVATPTDSHEAIAVAAFQKGKHVFLEKPMAPTLAAVDRVLATWRASGRFLQVGYVYRYSPLIQRFVSLVHGGAIGRVHQLWAHEFRAAFFEAWRFDPARSGGALLEKICHHADVFNWIVGEGARRVVAMGGQAVMRAGEEVDVLAVDGNRIRVVDSGVVDHAWVTAEYPSGAIASFGVNFFCPSGFHGQDLSDLEGLEIGAIGERGAALCHVRQGRIRLRRADTGEEQLITVPPARGRPQGWHSGTPEQLEAFVSCLRTNTPPHADGEVGREGMLIPLAAELSLSHQEIIDLQEELR